MSQVSQTAEEVFDSLTGFDEIAIAQHFGRTVSDLATTDQTMWGRALIFVVKRRDGLVDDDARTEALAMPLKDSLEFFAGKEESGKDESPEPSPESSPSSASSPDEAETSTSA